MNHKDNCCVIHGCHYGYQFADFCPVFLGKERRNGQCAKCVAINPDLAGRKSKCTFLEEKRFRAAAEEWFATTAVWSETPEIAIRVAAELLANQEGLTFYESHR